MADTKGITLIYLLFPHIKVTILLAGKPHLFLLSGDAGDRKLLSL